MVGGYGAFGKHVAQRLALRPGLEIIIAGRSAARAATFADQLARSAKAKISHTILDATKPRAPRSLRRARVSAGVEGQTQPMVLSRASD